MQVHGAHTGLTPSGNWPHTKPVDTTSSGGSGSTVDPHRSEGASTGLIGILRSRLAELPEVRVDRIEAVRQAVESGEYFTRSAAEGTAKAILGGV